ncbi:4'-phosphopantetheinyl transferase family protein [Paenibacillus sp. 1-18]|uniref:4'-phosphopantetheinyl transferase family protein n=1 Tax=Paenibacillus sp. 1-18 TaxID=1333846 RepID=UPI000471144E|nr:4'-phosphopantetheinyl transferase superfamily protein [Paenibacillus sp. 1-18]
MASYVEQLMLKREDAVMKAAVSFVYADYNAGSPLDRNVFHLDECSYFESLEFHRRKSNFLLGRLSAKQAASVLLSEPDLRNVSVKTGVFGQPVLRVTGVPSYQVSITHCDSIGAAVVFPEVHPMGIDIERIDPKRNKTIESQLTTGEKERISAARGVEEYSVLLTVFWTVKEALSKILRTGFTTSLHVLEMNETLFVNEYFRSTFSHFPQYAAQSYRLGDYICTIAAPRRTEWSMNTSQLYDKFNSVFHPICLQVETFTEDIF